jgi:hypothetical protein
MAEMGTVEKQLTKALPKIPKARLARVISP